MEPHQLIFNNPISSIDLHALASPIQLVQIIDNYMGTETIVIVGFFRYDLVHLILQVSGCPSKQK